MRRIRPADHRCMPWRNGGGTTREIFVEPTPRISVGPSLGSSRGTAARFALRLSLADVEIDGPFSRFEGYDRHIVLIAGHGMTLGCGSHGSIELRPLSPASFSGDWEVYGTLRSGPVRDFNFIVDRTWASSSMELREVDVAWRLEVAAGETCFVHVLDGALEAADAGDTLVVEASALFVPRGRTRLIVARVSPLGSQPWR